MAKVAQKKLGSLVVANPTLENSPTMVSDAQSG